jgi:hypothetical protein
MAEIKKISTELQLLDKFLDTSGDAGTSGQILSSTGTGINWVSGSAIPGVPSGSGTLNTIPLWTPDGDTLGNSIITQPSTGVVRVSGSSVYFSVTDTSAAARNIDIGHWVAGQTNIESVGGILSIGTQSNHDIVFETNGSTKATILSGGNVGIGTTSPTAKLDVNGEIKGASFSGPGQGLSNLLSLGAYQGSPAVGILIATNIVTNNYSFIFGTIKIEQFNFTSKQTIEFSATTNNNGTLITKDATSDVAITFKLFNYSGKWYLWFPMPSTYSTCTAFVNTGAGYQGQSKGFNEVSTVTVSAVPSSGVTNSYDITPKVYLTTSTPGGNLPGGPYLPLTGGTLSGPGNLTIEGTLTGTTASFNSGATNVVASFTSTDGIAGIKLQDSGGNVELSASGNTFQVQPAGGSAALSVTSTTATFTGDVGIGTTSPLSKFDLRGTAYVTGYAVGFDTSPQGNYAYRLTNDGANSFINVLGGNVGIGTTSPLFKLQTNATITGGWLGYLNGTSATFGTNNFSAVHNSTAIGTGTESGINLANNASDVGAPSPIISFSAKSASGSYQHAYAAIYGIKTATGADTNWNKGDLVFATGSSTGPNERIRVTSAGNVGIGVTNPGIKLQVLSASEQLTNFSSSVADQLAYSQINASSSTTGTITAAAALELVGQANASGHGRHAWIGAEGTPNTTFETKLKFKIRGAAGGYDWSGSAEAPTIMTLEGTGNVGIGTTSPNQSAAASSSTVVSTKAKTSGGVAITELIGLANNNNDKVGLISFISQNATSALASIRGLRYTSDTTGKLAFFTSGAEKMRIDYNGNVGVGVTGPVAPLDVFGAAVQNGSTPGIKLSSSNTQQTVFAIGNTGTRQYELAVGGTTSSVPGAFYIYDNNAADFRITLATSGNVGIGTTTPGEKLEVNGVIQIKRAGDHPAIRFVENTTTRGYIGTGDWAINGLQDADLGISSASTGSLVLGTNSGNGRVYIVNGGNVGIGTTSPTNKLHIQGSQTTVYSPTDSGGQASAGTTINNTNTAGNTNNFSQLLFTVGTNNNSVSRIVAIRSGSDASDLAFVGKSAAGVAEYMRIKSGGNVGIGTDAPLGKLDVSGTLVMSVGTTARFKTFYSGGFTFINGGVSGNDIYFGAPTSYTQNIRVQGTGIFNSTVTATNFILSSDKTLKENVKDIDTKHIDVNWKNFELKSEPGVKRSGVIAQELEKKHPEFVRTNEDGLKSVAYIDLLIAKIAELEARLEKAGI